MNAKVFKSKGFIIKMTKVVPVGQKVGNNGIVRAPTGKSGL